MADQNILLLLVSVKTKEKVLFEGTAETVTSFNLRGRFDILPHHANFITLVSKYVIIDTGKETERKFDIDKGILYAMSNRVSVYVGI
ncbi:MAG: ATP synthase epsilon chain [candidate division WWE3 bacterium GW2011_GWF2_41_45]|uniref:ATP synthase F1 complex delta/epsilon subunit N-terminal domain-containing protein n=3 Tax=Katanobacteria TaxID=422282 RepID=A0A1F4W3S0_UNCKA|nr:MAG: ATP synthase epsilon chain [candidate division WWE3 bacterium GW2011_GWC2_41_23]KKS09943.1 MAG: ATP synthase epsilon chain [candidate division WWE3 bacterium GW2011_GWF2_41_45]KKS11920.1 MAG: ATP synthase epsilon chain [candidate division WWE3 bacterium GW2011_GWF1_41_53]KKS19589.1 MAG: ATP synthase epsilon chain [candidate division WWE3 bacterium GW2011_GWE1_41_72]KKS28122.1 MAG: ATP synthase epsilon chain [candidate division WWE3 bacterium GW2011_GWC1_42_102]KKS28814.1 MAG: ATP synth